mmetsp:Transcript_6168/g.15825  ORF Transcript_6168/g.15825 Transcript_6168/m.15825 type:complete len:252 (-) Transcript_6168:1304-2059(-)
MGPPTATGAPEKREHGPREPKGREPTTLRVLTEAQIRVAARMSAEAFVASPTYAYVLAAFSSYGMKDPEAAKVDALHWLFRCNFAMRLPLGACRVATASDGSVECLYLLEPPEAMVPLSILTMLWAGLWQVPFRFGLRAMARLLSVIEWYEQKMAEVAARVAVEHGGLRCWKLERMSVSPDCQGHGIGTACLQQGLDEVDAKGDGVLLTTQLERNVRFYTRLGFEVIEEADFHADETITIPNWFMLRCSSS